MRKNRQRIILITGLFLLGGSLVFAQGAEQNEEIKRWLRESARISKEYGLGAHSLKGLGDKVFVVVGEPPEYAVEDGLTRRQLQVDTELKLRQAGIQVVSQEKSFELPGSPYLYVNVNLIKNKHIGYYAFFVSVELNQIVLMERDTSIKSFAETWSRGTIGLVGKKTMPDFVRSNVGDLVDEFLNTYLAVNPKETIEREQSPARQDTQTKYVGNRQTKVFHLAECSSGASMDSAYRVPLDTREEALRQGFRPCNRCKP